MKNMFRIFAVGIMLASGAAFSGEIEITGCVKSCTAIPEVSRLDYPNCLYTAESDVYRMTGKL